MKMRRDDKVLIQGQEKYKLVGKVKCTLETRTKTLISILSG
jgi:hypothetical protein